jgi:hypothetical protein
MTVRSRRSARAAITALAALGGLSVTLGSGCAMSSSDGNEATRTSGATQALLGACLPLACCFPKGGEWGDNPFEQRLRDLGCTKPHAYAESFGTSGWWLYSTCPASLDLTGLVLQYALVSPYFSQLAVNECLELQAIGGGDPTSAFVEWDPTCGSCSSSYSASNDIFLPSYFAGGGTTAPAQ